MSASDDIVLAHHYTISFLEKFTEIAASYMPPEGQDAVNTLWNSYVNRLNEIEPPKAVEIEHANT